MWQDLFRNASNDDKFKNVLDHRIIIWLKKIDIFKRPFLAKTEKVVKPNLPNIHLKDMKFNFKRAIESDAI